MFVYVIECEGRIKIGMASKPRRRVSQMRVASPFPMRLCATAQFASAASAGNAERLAHVKFEASRSRGEWFTAKIDDVIAYLTSVGGTVKDLNRASGVSLPEGWSTGGEEALVSYLETHMGGMTDENVFRLAQVHGRSTGDRHELACVIAQKHANRKHASTRKPQPRAIRP